MFNDQFKQSVVICIDCAAINPYYLKPHVVAGLPPVALIGSWYCKSCVQENDTAAAATLAEVEAAAKAARLLSKKGKSKGAMASG